MVGLQFPFDAIVAETITLQKIARQFLCRTTEYVLDDFKSNIESFESKPAGTLDKLRFCRLKTNSTDLYGPEIYAAFSGIWDVISVSHPKKSSMPKNIMFCGIASTKIELYRTGNDKKPIAMWRLELGTHDSPGCYFHAQILGKCKKPPFPKSVPIPRLPSLFVTPMAAVEYGIGELFQKEWSRHTARKTGDLHYWSRLQQPRLECLLEWYKNSLADGGSSPWMNLKVKKPNSQLFLSENFG